ncbi:MAG TPA: hypothetical protein VII23_22335 [Terriglobales bacterium]
MKRFGLLDFESRNVIDFYFLGWDAAFLGSIRFDLYEFENVRRVLRAAGITKFGGNADLILVDAHYRDSIVSLNFEQAIRIDLSSSVSEKEISTLGAFLQSIIETAEEVKSDAKGAYDRGIVFSISDRLGLAIAKTSMLDFVLEKWGKIIGAKKLKRLVVQNLGPMVDLHDLGP